MGSSTSPDPFRSDAALVFRHLRDVGPADAVTLADAVFPVATEGPPSSIKAIRKSGLRRVYDSIVWMRHQGVTFTVVRCPTVCRVPSGRSGAGRRRPLRASPRSCPSSLVPWECL
jgi:hypothetical protein